MYVCVSVCVTYFIHDMIYKIMREREREREREIHIDLCKKWYKVYSCFHFTIMDKC